MPMFQRSMLVLLVMALTAMGVTAFMLAEEDAVQPLDAGVAAEASVTVYVTGAVRRPGVVTLPPGRVEQAVAACGGASPEAALEQVNMALPLEDGMHIQVPATGRDGALAPGAADDGRIHINTADEKELERLPGIGPVMARRIIEYRTQHGAFQKIEDLRQVRGIGEAKLARLKEKAAL